MRAVKKGKSPKKYSDYKDAVYDLAGRIGWYCSYCEMPVKNMIEIEHVIPQNNGGAKLDWNNFLLSCKYCNTVKSNNNKDRTGYLFPDEDNTSIAYKYSQTKVLEPNNNLSSQINQFAKNTINLCGLDRKPGHTKLTKSDKRWISRDEAWSIAKVSYRDYTKHPLEVVLNAIIRTAVASGHYSIWLEIFKNKPEFKAKLDKKIKGTYITIYDKNGNSKKRRGGKI